MSKHFNPMESAQTDCEGCELTVYRDELKECHSCGARVCGDCWNDDQDVCNTCEEP